MKLISVAWMGALLMTSFAAGAGEPEVRVVSSAMKNELPARGRVEPKRRTAPQRVQKQTARPAKYDPSLDWPQLG